MIFEYIKIKYFLLSLAIGLFYIYISNDYKKVIVLYPNPQNVNKYVYKDKGNNCFTYKLEETSCPNNPLEYVNIDANY
jgi:hypothetical protein